MSHLLVQITHYQCIFCAALIEVNLNGCLKSRIIVAFSSTPTCQKRDSFLCSCEQFSSAINCSVSVFMSVFSTIDVLAQLVLFPPDIKWTCGDELVKQQLVSIMDGDYAHYQPLDRYIKATDSLSGRASREQIVQVWCWVIQRRCEGNETSILVSGWVRNCEYRCSCPVSQQLNASKIQSGAN